MVTHLEAVDTHNISISSSSDLKQLDPVMTSSDSKPITTTSASQTSSDIVESPSSLPTDSPEKRRSWLYKSLIKANKKASNKGKPMATHSDDSNTSTPNAKSPAASIVDEFYQKNPRPSLESSKPKQLIKLRKNHNKHCRSHTLHPSLSANMVESSSNHHSRRHSFDSYSSFIKESSSNASSIQEEALNHWDQEIRQELEVTVIGQLERISTDHSS
jgi:hypothetical protein